MAPHYQLVPPDDHCRRFVEAQVQIVVPMPVDCRKRHLRESNRDTESQTAREKI